MEEITLDPNKHYLLEEPFFICSADGRHVEVLRMANYWDSPSTYNEKTGDTK